MEYQKSAQTEFIGETPVGLLDHIKSHVLAFDLPVEERDDSLTVFVPGSATTFLVLPDRMTVSVDAQSDATLFQARESIGFLLDHVFPHASAAMVWDGDLPTDKRPPNFQTALLLGTKRIGANFVRVTLRCSDMSKLLVGGMHFTLAVPAAQTQPVWPHLNEKGRTVWPEGEHALHRAAYTFVSLCSDTAEMCFDVFLHDGGRMSDWALRAKAVDIVGVIGPGGGDFPKAEHLVMGGDETALPAIRRILETAPSDQRGSVWLEIGDAGDRLDIDCPEQVQLRWLHRGKGMSLETCLKTAEREPNSFVWFAAEQNAVRSAKTYFKSQGLPRDQGYFAIYWTQ